MEGFSLYMLKSFIWLTGFALIYLLFLRNERFFLLNRFYLLSGILVSVFFPVITVHYIIELPANTIKPLESHSLTTIRYSTKSFIPLLNILILCLYLSGVLVLIFRLIRQVFSIYRLIKNTVPNNLGQAKLIRTTEFRTPFSFFNYIFINPSINDIEMKEIVNHELVHIRQKHWLDLMLAELLYTAQWFNPFAWIYVRLIKQNHEYFTDQIILQHSSHPGVYKAALLNQMFKSQVISLTDSFNFSLNKKRFEMMKKIKTSPYRKMKLLFVLPVFVIIFYSFAKTEYRYTSPVDNSENPILNSETTLKEVNVSGIQEDGKPLQDTIIKKSVYTELNPEEMPKFNGGDPAVEFRKYITENMKYPQIAKEKGISGRVIVQFIVTSKGIVSDVKILDSSSEILNEAVTTVIKNSSVWTPGKHKGKAVSV